VNILCGISNRGGREDASPSPRQPTTHSPILRMAATIAGTHHERWDGTGYPHGLAGEAIPLEGRIVAVADVLDALGSWRPYKEPLPFDQCVKILEEGRGKHFDPRVLDAFQRRKAEIARDLQELRDWFRPGA
jgi:putative two-component system response regulator